MIVIQGCNNSGVPEYRNTSNMLFDISQLSYKKFKPATQLNFIFILIFC